MTDVPMGSNNVALVFDPPKTKGYKSPDPHRDLALDTGLIWTRERWQEASDRLREQRRAELEAERHHRRLTRRRLDAFEVALERACHDAVCAMAARSGGDPSAAVLKTVEHYAALLERP